ncbi:IS701 family transposase [Streptomyces cyaneofuscatus]|uniref:IS701 family transposase n=1 Tax=Streptomyces sp. 021-4 TaxID=2789260 RepID=UPI0039F5B5D0
MFTQLRPAGSRRQALDDFAKLLFGQLPRADQREWANTYLRGLLCTTGKKSMRRLAESVSTSPTAWYSLQQFISGSSWDWEEPRGELARWVDQRASVRAWTVATATMPKRGDQSVGVHRRFIPSVGRTVNCQLGTALFLSCPGANFPTDWRLHLPTEWAADRRTQLAAARIPEDVTPQPLWQDALDLIDTAAARGVETSVPVVADLSDLDDAGLAVARLEARGLSFVVAVPRGLEVRGEEGGPGAPRPQHRRGVTPPTTVGGLLELHGGQPYRYTAAIMGASGGFRQIPVLSAYFRLARQRQGSPGAQQVYRLFSQPDSALQGAIWMTNLTHRRLDELLELALLHTSAMATVTCLDERFALLDFAGRSFPGWHHHMTLASAAYAFARLSQPGELPSRVAARRREDAMMA